MKETLDDNLPVLPITAGGDEDTVLIKDKFVEKGK